MTRVTFTGPELAALTVPEPAASVRLLLPSPGSRELVIPTWSGNDYRLPDGTRATIRTFTPRRFAPPIPELDLDIVIHGEGVAPAWALAARPGDAAAISGPARGYAIEASAPEFLLAGDETAIPAISQLLESLPDGPLVRVLIEVASGDARLALPPRPDTVVEWLEAPPGTAPGQTLVNAVAGAELGTGARVWAAGEAAAMQRIRRHLFGDRALTRAQAVVRGYWKHGRAGDVDDS